MTSMDDPTDGLRVLRDYGVTAEEFARGLKHNIETMLGAPRQAEGVTSMDDLVTWLRAQLDNDWRMANQAQAKRWDHLADAPWESARWKAGRLGRIGLSYVAVAEAMVGTFAHPDRVLDEVDAKRRIIAALDLTPCPCASGARCVPHDASAGPPVQRHTDPQAEAVLRALALPYADQPGYREEWRP